MSDSKLHVLGALALELAPGSAAGRDALPQREAGALAAAIARDLAGFEPEAATLELTTVGAHYDPVELLRPGWPIHANSTSSARARRAIAAATAGRIIAFGSHDGHLPGALSPSPDYAGGPLRLVPWSLAGDADTARARRRCLRTRPDGTRHGRRRHRVAGAGSLRAAASSTRAT